MFDLIETKLQEHILEALEAGYSTCIGISLHVYERYDMDVMDVAIQLNNLIESGKVIEGQYGDYYLGESSYVI